MSPQNQNNTPLLSIKNISLSFKGVKAISDISFDVMEHEICSLIGPNGAGKSSMLNVVNGVYQAQEGSITFDGYTSKHMRAHNVAVRGIARTFQNIASVSGNDGAGQHHDRQKSQDESNFCRTDALLRACAPRGD